MMTLKGHSAPPSVWSRMAMQFKLASHDPYFNVPNDSARNILLGER